MGEKQETIKQFTDRKRTNLLSSLEQPTLLFLCKIMPSFVTSNMLTFVGFVGSFFIFLGIYWAKEDSRYFFLALAAFVLQWFGDSLDGRLAYYRNTPRKWYGFALDMCVDWISTVLMGIGFFYYLPEDHKIYVYFFVAGYAWTMILALLKYRITDNYAIDMGLFGPTEMRFALCGLLLSEYFFPGSMSHFAFYVNFLLVTINLVDIYKILKLANLKDQGKL